jgi:integrin-linked kinase
MATRDDHDFTALHWAVRYSQVPAVELLLGRSPDLEARNVGGDTVLHLAATEGNLEVVKKVRQSSTSVSPSGTTLIPARSWWSAARP